MPEAVMREIRAVEAQLRAKRLTKDQLIELSAAVLVAAEGLSEDLKTERNKQGRGPGTVAILDALATSAKEGWNMRHVVETALQTLAPNHETLLALNTVLIGADRDSRSSKASTAAKVRHGSGPKHAAKEFARQCWSEWRSDPSLYKSKVDFADDMLVKYSGILKSAPVIAGWIREWDRAEK